MERPYTAARAVLMVRPVNFGYNAEAAADNHYMQALDVKAEAVREAAISEFELAVEALQAAGVYVVVPPSRYYEQPLPDAVFPNNWLVCWPDGRLMTFPMKVASRKAELKQLDAVQEALEEAGLGQREVLHFAKHTTWTAPLEGTGSVILDHAAKHAYIGLSQRTDRQQARALLQLVGYRGTYFPMADGAGREIYHTNLVLALGPGISVVCLEAVPDEAARAALAAQLATRGQVLSISLAQMAEGFAGNMLALQDKKGQPLWALSKQALEVLNGEQKQQLEATGRLVALGIPTIEQVGGGSVRCMLAELF